MFRTIPFLCKNFDHPFLGEFRKRTPSHVISQIAIARTLPYSSHMQDNEDKKNPFFCIFDLHIIFYKKVEILTLVDSWKLSRNPD